MAELERMEKSIAGLKRELEALGATTPTHSSLREAVDDAMCELGAFTVSELKLAVRRRHTSSEGSSINTALNRAVQAQKVEMLGDGRYRVKQEWQAKRMHSD